MSRALVAGCLLALIYCAAPVRADVVARQMPIHLPTVTGMVFCLSEEAADSLLISVPWGPGLLIKREMYRMELRQRLGQDVMLVTVIVTVDSSSTGGIEMTAGDKLNVKHGKDVINGFGILYTIDVLPGRIGATFAVFGRFTVQANDDFVYESIGPPTGGNR